MVIVAPAGFGKSTFLTEWGAHDSRPFVHLSGGRARADGTLIRRLQSVMPFVLSAVGPCVVVLDDAHLVDADALRELVEEAEQELCYGSTLALASRTSLALPLGRSRAHRNLIELGVDELALTSTESAVLLRRAGLELDVDTVRALVDRTGGWPAALYLASLVAREADDPSAVKRLRGDDHRLAQYFRDEVLSELSPSQVEFAVRTSVLDELSGPVCDSVLDCRGSGAALRELAQACPLLRPVDPAHERFSWHRLIRETLQAESRRIEPEMIPVLHARASSWHLIRGDREKAIAHAIGAHDCTLSGDLLWPAVVEYVSQGRNAIVQSWLAEFSRAELNEHAPLGLAAAFSSLAAGNGAEARHLAVAAAAAIERAPGDPAESPLGASLAGIEAMVGSSGVAGMADAAARACALEPGDGPWRSTYLLLRGTALYLSGQRTAAERVLEEAADLSAVTAPAIMSISLAQAAMIAIERHDWESATDLTDRAADVIEARTLAESPLCALPFAALAASRAQAGRIDEAKLDLRRGIDLSATLGDDMAWYGAQTRLLLAHASVGLADVVGARTLLAEASRLARRTEGAVVFGDWFDSAWSDMDAFAEERLAGPSSLTIAELRILRFLPSHRSFREIAEQLGVSANTVKTQAHAVYRKLGAASRSEAVERAADAGLLSR